MIHDFNVYEKYLRQFAILYFMLGYIEREFRIRIVATLGSLASEKGYSAWTFVIPETFENSRALERAQRKNRGHFEDMEKYLNFAFWGHLFKPRNFTTLWIPALHTIFPSLSNPQSKESFAQVSNKVGRAYEIRNRIAHFDLESAEHYKSERAVLLWIINALQGPSR